jgi:hypothetical protein
MQATLVKADSIGTLKDLVLLSDEDKRITKTYVLWVLFCRIPGFHTQGRNPVKALITVTSDIGRIDVSVTIANHTVALPVIKTRCGIVHSPKVLGDLFYPVVHSYLVGKYPTMVGTAPDTLEE